MLSKSSAGQAAGPTDPGGQAAAPTDHARLQPERPPDGELAWPHPESDGSDARRVVLTQRGLDLLARWRGEVALFGREVSA